MIELGDGYGGLAAMNAIVLNATTIFTDLPPVIDAAMLQMKEIGLGKFASTDHGIVQTNDVCFISNYSFTEPSRELQDNCADQFIRHANRGVILSNAAVFADHMQSRNNNEIIDLLKANGVTAHEEKASHILCPSDQYHGNSILRWKKR